MNIPKIKRSMYKDDSAHRNPSERSSEDVYSNPVRAGKRTYFFDVKSTKDCSDYFLTITESKRRTELDGSFSFDKHKIFLYKEDFEKFRQGLEDALAYIKENLITDEPSDNSEKRFTDISFDDIK